MAVTLFPINTSGGVSVETFDTDTGPGTENVLGVSLRKAANGGSVELGTNTNPIKTDPTGTTTQPVSGTVAVSNFPATQAISGSVSVSNLPAVQPISDNGGSVTVDGSVSVSGSVTVSNFPVSQEVVIDSGTVSVDNFPSVQPINDNGGSITVDGAVSVSNFPATQNVTVTNFPGTQPVSGTVNVGNFPATQAISAASLPLPTGAATETTLATLLTSSVFTGRINTLGQKTAVNSTPVVLASDQSALTVSGSVSVSNFPSVTPINDNGGSITVDGTVAISSQPLPTGASTEATLATLLLNSTFTGRINTLGQKTAANSTPVVLASDQSALTVSGSVSVSNFPATQPVSGTVNVGNFPATQAVSAVSLPLPTGAATETTLATLLTSSTFTGRINTLGQKTAANSTPVVLASDQSSLTVSVSNFPATQAISAASLPLPTGAATETTLASRLADATFTGRINTLGQKTAANSTPVVLASDQSTLNVSSTFPTGSLSNGTQTAVSGIAVQIVAANASRKTAIIQNVGSGACRVGVAGVTSTTGLRLGIGDTIVFDMPYCPTNALFAIQDDLASTTVLVQEIS